MKHHITIKDYIIIASLLIVGIIIILFTQRTGKENIRPIVEESLSQTIDIDYYRRRNEMFQHTKGKGVGRKIKSIKIDTGNGLEYIVFEDTRYRRRRRTSFPAVSTPSISSIPALPRAVRCGRAAR